MLIILKIIIKVIKSVSRKKSCRKLSIYGESNIKEVISTIEKGGLKIALIFDKENKLLGTVCDGDIRRALLRGLTLESSISEIINKKFIKASINKSKKDIFKLMKEKVYLKYQ